MVHAVVPLLVSRILTFQAPPTPEQAEQEGSGCSLRAGADDATVTRFVTDLRAALASDDDDTLVRLVRLPLRVNSEDPRHHQTRTRYFRTVEELRAHTGVFGRDFRDRILRDAPDDVICVPGAIGVANGLVWASIDERGRVLIDSVNNDSFRWEGMEREELFRCRTSTRLIVVDRPATKPRYREWKSPRGSAGPPTRVLHDGEESFEGTGVCVHRTWTFEQRSGRVLLREPGCGPEGDAVAYVQLPSDAPTAGPRTVETACVPVERGARSQP
jgi:hypothetical protein